MADIVTTRALNRALLERQWLTKRVEATVSEAVEHLVGMQAQHGDAPYFQLWCRLRKFRLEDLSTLLQHRRLVRIVTMRGTIHLVTAEDCLPLRDLVRSFLQRENKADKNGYLTSEQVEKVTAQAHQLLSAHPMNSADLAEHLQQQWPELPGRELVRVVRNSLPVLQTPPRGVWGESGPLAYALASEWLPDTVPTKADPHKTVLRYLRAFGPASVKDYQQWSGITRQHEVFQQLGDRLRTYRDPDGVTLFDVEEAPVPDEEVVVPRIAMAGPFDNVFLSHADRTRVINDQARAKLNRPNAVFPGVFLCDGFVAGEWVTDFKRGSATVTFRPYRTLHRSDRELLEEEGRQLLRFSAEKVEKHTVEIMK